jgi:F-type H+-transporting ATPase subunit epsilon
MRIFHLTVSTVTESKFDGEALSILLPGSEGVLEILADHEPFITTLKAGMVTIKTEDSKYEEKFSIENGILEVANNRVVVLV